MFMQRVLKPLQSLHRGGCEGQLIPLQSIHKRGCEGQNALPPPTDSRIQTPHHPPKNVGSLASLWGGGGTGITCSCSACSNHCNHYTGGGVRDSMLYPRPMLPNSKPPPTPPKNVASLGSLWCGVHVVPAHATTITTQGGMGGGDDLRSPQPNAIRT